MKKIKTAVLALALVSSVSAWAQQAQPWTYKTKQLERAEVDALLAAPDKLVVLDVRRPDEVVSKGSFPVFLNIQAKDVENRLAYIPKDRVIVTVSNHAHRAGAIGDLLTAKGFKVAGAAGSEDYEALGGKIVRITPPAPAAPAKQVAAAGQN